MEKAKWIHVGCEEEYEADSMPPTDYVEWHRWAEAQLKAGIKQKWYEKSEKWKFSQEIKPGS